MAIRESQLFSPKLLGDTETVIMTCPNNTDYVIIKPEVFNISTSNQDITFWIVSPDQTPGDGNLHSIRKIAARQNTIIRDLVNTSLAPGWSLVAKAELNNEANIKITARVVN